MSEVEAKVDAIISGKTFSSPAARERVRAGLIQTMKSIKAIRGFEEDDSSVDAPNEYRYDDSDGVPCMTIADLEQGQDDKKLALRKQARSMFDAEDFVAEQSGCVATVDTDINAKLKWGYTALHFAAIAGNETECLRLLELGADKTVLDNSNKMPYQKAEYKGFAALAAMLKP